MSSVHPSTPLLLAALGMLFMGTPAAQASDPNPQNRSFPAATSSFADLGRGVNIGNYLENPHPGDWKIKFEPETDFKRIRAAGFTNVRIPLNFSAHVSQGPGYSIENAYFQKVDQVLAAATAAGLKIIIDDHNETALMADPDANAARFIAEWRQVSEHYRNQPSTVYFEVLNEPIKKMDMANVNKILAQAIPVIRATNPDRTIVVGPAWSYSAAALAGLVLPPGDRHLLVTVHYYSPLHFTHQGAAFVEGASAWLGTTWTGSDEEKKAVTGGKDGFDLVLAWAKANDRPIYLGEYGSYLKGDVESRGRWSAFVARTAEADGMSWSFYDYASGFGVCDPDTKQWIRPLLNALIPNS